MIGDKKIQVWDNATNGSRRGFGEKKSFCCINELIIHRENNEVFIYVYNDIWTNAK